MSLPPVLRACCAAAGVVLLLSCGGAEATKNPKPVQRPVINAFKADPESISQGGSSTLSWNVQGATQVRLEPGFGVVAGTSQVVKPTATTTYWLTASNQAGESATQKVEVTVEPQVVHPIIHRFAPAPTQIAKGESATLTWDVSGATQVRVDPEPGVVDGTSCVVRPTETTTYVLTASRGAETVTATASVTVNQVQEVRVTLDRTDIDLSYGEQATFRATVQGTPQTGVAWRVEEGIGGAVDGNGNYTAPGNEGTFHVVAASLADPTKSAVATIRVKAPAVPEILSIKANPETVQEGGKTMLSWSVNHATSLTLEPGTGTVTGTQIEVKPTAPSTTYTLIATNGVGPYAQTARASVIVTVTPAGNVPKIVSFKADRPVIAPGANSTLTWEVTGATHVEISEVGTVTGNQWTVSPVTTTTYKMTAQQGNVTVTSEAKVTVKPSLKVLFVGNSLTNRNNLPDTFRKLAAALNISVQTTNASIDGLTLAQHVSNTNTQQKINAMGPWDYVVMQENTDVVRASGRHQEMETAARTLADTIRKSSPEATLVMYMAFPYGDRTNQDYETMVSGYNRAAQAIQALVMPGAVAFRNALNALPGVTPYLENDNNHPTLMTTYMMACGLVGVLFERNPEDLAEYLDLTSDLAGFAQARAAEALLAQGVVLPARTRVMPPPLQPVVDGEGWNKIDERDLRIGWSFRWSSDSANTGAYGGRFISAAQANEKVWFTFNGNQVRLFGRKGPDGGMATVYIDETQIGSIDAYAANTSFGLLFERVGLTSGAHTLKVVLSGTKQAASSGNQVGIDAFAYRTTP